MSRRRQRHTIGLMCKNRSCMNEGVSWKRNNPYEIEADSFIETRLRTCVFINCNTYKLLLPGPRDWGSLRRTWTGNPWWQDTPISGGRRGGAYAWKWTRCRREWRWTRRGKGPSAPWLERSGGPRYSEKREHIYRLFTDYGNAQKKSNKKKSDSLHFKTHLN